MEYLIGIIVALAGALFYTRGKQKSAEAINENVDMKTEVQKTQANIDVNSATNVAEDAKRTEIANETKQDAKPVDSAALLDFFKKLK